MTEPPRSERERDLVREIVELVAGAGLRRRSPDAPPPPLEPAGGSDAPPAPTDEEHAK